MPRWVRTIIAGVGAGGAYLLAQGVDRAITNNRLDDRVLVGRLLPVRRDHAVAVGTVLHLVNSIALAGVFRHLVRDRLPGPMWSRGLVFALVETVLAYPVALLEDAHPAIRDGQLDSFQTPTAFAQQAWRHAVFGGVLGWRTPKRD